MLAVLVQTGRVAAEATLERLHAIGIDAQVLDEPNVFVKLACGGNYRVSVVVPEEDLESARAELARWEVEAGPRIDALVSEVRLAGLRMLRVFLACVLASLAYGGAIYGLVRWREILAVKQAAGGKILDARLMGFFWASCTDGDRRLHLEQGNRYTLEELVQIDGEYVLRDGSSPDRGRWTVRLDDLLLHSDSGLVRSARISYEGGYFDLLLEGTRYVEPRPFECY